eukprot:COSAG02_NODE_1617_length_11651_cov_10.500519_3_plen_69_part_00
MRTCRCLTRSLIAGIIVVGGMCSSLLTQWVLLNLFVVILVDNFSRCHVISKMDIQPVRLKIDRQMVHC